MKVVKFKLEWAQFCIICSMYCMEGNFGSEKRWRIWQMTVDSPNFIQLKKVLHDKIHLRYYTGIRHCRF